MNKLLKEDLEKLRISGYNSLNEEKFNELILLLNKRYEQKQSNLERFLNSILDEIPCTVSLISSDLKYKWVNKLLADQMGRDKEDFIGESLGLITKDDKFTLFTKELFKSSNLRMEKIIHVEVKNYNKFFYVIGKKNKDGDLATIIGMDVTELKRLEEEHKFDSQMRQLGEMTSQIVHEINNPLSAIAMLNEQSSFLINDDEDFEEVELIYNKLLGNSNKIKSMISTISLIIEGTKLMSKKDSSIKKERIEIEKLINQVKIIAEAKAKRFNVNITYENKSNLKYMEGNFVNLMQVFLNLISNSIDAIESKDKKWIKVVLKNIDDKLTVEFIDSGFGIEEKIAKNMFKPFFSSKPIGKGNGIGLDLCKKIISDHDGEIFLDTSRKNTTFVLKF
jgi:signal transduction histidine kinase